MIEVLYAIALVMLVAAALPALFEWLWNMTMPEVFGMPALNYWQSFRLLLIAHILFGVPIVTLSIG
ncbi:hypothetical protein BST95_12245 [Halioglobus japonicus]|uniref:Uncharacterized protein n=1 Tax=Halioglobus japonicus TaxID=930805 RepID=A0AAP8SLA8_9GAMM|nr:hypothetical protein [Halioglobus japonicus]AQA18893.1 hypothetical protein BST95_12245 [Halioglobus japonicus]PLW84495.1 hypothetical protein C0029_18930 [Halioglobus japonicus]GHD24662.1 hypothetical protein GCM10007052_38280 [Halioglobus japonicus]